ncbi:MAG TPA: ATP-binding protein, partial [Bryobacteraceae bacterium]|nr:ATP-binding protein [Bryobacteraceae bacterium]
ARSNGELEQFAYVASHDLQEPLRKIQAFGDRLKTKFSDGLPNEGKDYLERMQNAAYRMQTLINDLLTLSRVATQTRPFVDVDLSETAWLVQCDLESRIEQLGGSVEVGALPVIAADRVQMSQLLQNLIGNGLKFHKPDVPPRVTVRSAKVRDPNGAAEDVCRISVEDNGIGFDEKYCDRIFQVFQRLHGRNEYEGTGIGLAICRKIVERHGGTITAHSTPGTGSQFVITLPFTNHGETL